MANAPPMVVSFNREGLQALSRLSRALENQNQLIIETHHNKMTTMAFAWIAEHSNEADSSTLISQAKKIFPGADLRIQKEVEKPSDYIDIGPECFAGEGGNVISWKGEMFYKACDFLVTGVVDGGSTHCLKRVNHPTNVHEDYDGNTALS